MCALGICGGPWVARICPNASYIRGSIREEHKKSLRLSKRKEDSPLVGRSWVLMRRHHSIAVILNVSRGPAVSFEIGENSFRACIPVFCELHDVFAGESTRPRLSAVAPHVLRMCVSHVYMSIGICIRKMYRDARNQKSKVTD